MISFPIPETSAFLLASRAFSRTPPTADKTMVLKIPMIAITGNARNYSMEDFKEAGFNDFLAKPLNFDALVTQVKALTE